MNSATRSAEHQIQQILSVASQNRLPKQREVAELLAIPERTLRAKLAHEGTSFRAIQNRLMVTRAMEFLADPGRSVKEISFDLGFSLPSSFSRAFAKITGLPPERYRTLRLPGKGSASPLFPDPSLQDQ